VNSKEKEEAEIERRNEIGSANEQVVSSNKEPSVAIKPGNKSKGILQSLLPSSTENRKEKSETGNNFFNII
jgi:hypothetical protein